MLLRQARLVGGDGAPVDIAISGDRITLIGPDQPGTGTTIDLDGRWVMPGLWDHHVHFQQWAIARDRFDVSSATSAEAVAASVRDALAGRGAELFIAVGYKDGLWPEPATAAVLDAQTGDVPVVVVSTDLHATWLNSAALVRLGYPTDRAVLREQDAFDVLKAIGELSPARADQLVSAAAHAAAQRGVVGIVDFEFGDIGPVWQRRMAAGNTALRVHCSVWPEALDAAIARGHRTGDPLPGTQGRATMGPLKIIIDGSLNTRTAYCYDPYPGRTGPEAHGLLTVAPEQLVQLLTTAKQAGLSTAVHAIGDHANAIALDAYAQAGFGPSAGCTIEHAQLLTAGDMSRMADLGLIASVQPQHALDDEEVAERHWADRTDRAFPNRSLLDTGVRLALGSDAPVAPLDPWVAIAAAVERQLASRAADPDRGCLGGIGARSSRGRRAGRPGHSRCRSADRDWARAARATGRRHPARGHLDPHHAGVIKPAELHPHHDLLSGRRDVLPVRLEDAADRQSPRTRCRR